MRNKLLHLLLAVLALIPFASLGAPGTLTNSPLFLANSVKPNIMFTLDNSGSMTWTFMPDSVGNDPYSYWYNTRYGNSCYKNGVYNKVYYDPNVTYNPPVKADGSQYPDASFNAAPYDGYDSTEGTVDLRSQFKPDYFTPKAANGWYNGAGYEYYYSWQNDQQAAYYYKYTGTSPATPDPDTCYPNSDYTKVVVSATSGPGGTDERQNFANWFSYYRTRILLMKTAVGQAFGSLNDQYRVGFSTLNSASSNFIDTQDFDSTQRTAWYSKLYSIDPDGGTPLREALVRDGQYYESGYGTHSSPIQASCQQNFTIVSTDGYWSSNSGFNVGDQDNTIGTLPETVAGLTSGSQWPAPFYEGPTSSGNSLADVAMKYWITDLITSGTLSANNVPTSTADPASWQHMTTYTIGLGANGQLNYPGDWAGLQAGTTNWPHAVHDQPTTIDDLWHAAVNGHGQYLQANNPTSLSSGLAGLLGNIAGRTGSAAAVTFNTSTLGTNSAVYVALFNSTGWTGDLVSYPLDPVTGDVGTTPNWQAADVLDNRNLATSPRVMLTYNGTDGAAFQWGDLTTAEQNDLRTNSGGGTDAVAEGQARLNFIRGDRSNESPNGYGFRKRQSLLGDIVHSGPQFVGTPSVAWPDTAPFPTTTGQRFSDFRQAHLGRQGVIYVGTNDGMLHGFREDTGAEVLAYLPSNLFSTTADAGLHYLTDPNYTHRYYVDLTSTVTPAYVKTTPTGTAAWHTILVGAERGGGRGLFALDVTDPSSFSESNAANLVLWEFTNATDADLGYTYSQPTIALMNNGRWAAIFGNGYNDTGSGHAQLFIVFLDGGLNGTWTLGTDYLKLDTKAGSTTNRNGLSAPAVVDVNGDGVADRVYAGDLQGHMWAFDVSKSNDSQWGVAYGNNTTPEPLFTTAANQPITIKPEVAANPGIATTNANSPNLLVLFGTGQYLVTADKTTTDLQTMYGVWDAGTSSLTQAKLQQQTFESGFPANVRVPTNNSVAYTAAGNAQQFGWYLNLTDSGERLVTDPVLRGDYLYFNTWIPSSDQCSYGGSSWSMALNYATGGRPAAPAFDYNNDGVLDANDLVSNTGGGGTLSNVAPGGVKKGTLVNSPRFLSDFKYESSTGSQKPTKTRVPHLTGLNTGRLSWRELGR
ncbi:MAG: PilC/PilY family type IV pilus protein [Gammaproteobacteria bacterium]